MKVLYIGGTGEISYACVLESLKLGHQVSVFNRGRRLTELPERIEVLNGDIADIGSYSDLRRRQYDVVCQFFAFDVGQIERDLEVFGGNVGQYVFISTASAYYKPLHHHAVVTEDTPLTNPYWQYSQEKARMEKRLLEWHEDLQLPVTIIRPSHTYRQNFPTALGSGDWTAERLLAGKPIIVHGDGASLWTLTHASDFARPFVRLLGNEQALGEDFHITGDDPYTWDEIFYAMATALEVEPQLVHVASDTLVRYEPEWAGPLLGDKTPSTIFDNTKVKRVAGHFECTVGLDEGMRGVAEAYRRRKGTQPVEPDVDVRLYERIIKEQRALK